MGFGQFQFGLRGIWKRYPRARDAMRACSLASSMLYLDLALQREGRHKWRDYSGFQSIAIMNIDDLFGIRAAPSPPIEIGV